MSELYQRAGGQVLPGRESERIERKESLVNNNQLVTKLQQLTQFIVGLLSTLLLFRFLLALFGANSANAIVNGIYNLTDPLIAPFQGMITADAKFGKAEFQIETLVAILAYILLGFVVVRLLDIFKK